MERFGSDERAGNSHPLVNGLLPTVGWVSLWARERGGAGSRAASCVTEPVLSCGQNYLLDGMQSIDVHPVEVVPAMPVTAYAGSKAASSAVSISSRFTISFYGWCS